MSPLKAGDSKLISIGYCELPVFAYREITVSVEIFWAIPFLSLIILEMKRTDRSASASK